MLHSAIFGKIENHTYPAPIHRCWTKATTNNYYQWFLNRTSLQETGKPRLVTLTVYMNEIYEIKRVAGDKIALFGLFIVALLTAFFITTSRYAIVLSEPIKLSYAGLSVSMPTGNRWQSEKQWKYQENSFTLNSIFAPRSSSVTVLAHCQYLLAATKTTPDTLFKQKASAVGANVAKTGQIRTGVLTIDWAHIKKQKTPFEMFFGTARLPNSRQLDIEVHQAGGDNQLAEQLFKRIVEGLKFKDNQLLEAGSEIVAQIKSEGLSKLLDTTANNQLQNRQAFFLIKDAEGHTIGFMMDVLIWSNGEPSSHRTAEPSNLVQAASFYFLRGRYAQEQATFFQSDNSFDEFTWRSETSSPAGRSGTELILDKAGVMTVRKLGPQAEEKNYPLNPATVPEVFLELTFSQILDSDRKKILVDIIDANGKIMPVFVARIEAEDQFMPARASIAEDACYVLRMEILDGRGFSERVYLDGQRQISKRLLRQDGTYTIERTSAENILREFPAQADHILQRNKMLE